MAKSKKLAILHKHEAIDRTSTVVTMIDALLEDHPYIKKHKAIRKKILEAQSKLFDAYVELIDTKV